MTLEELRAAQLDSQARKASAQKLLVANTELEQVVTSVVNMESNSLIAAEQELMEAKHLLSGHKLRRARRSVLRAEANLAELERRSFETQKDNGYSSQTHYGERHCWL